jgi:hypothetical protein
LHQLRVDCKRLVELLTANRKDLVPKFETATLFLAGTVSNRYWTATEESVECYHEIFE